ncbi:MAG: hypothetical protein RLZZ324_311 [Candidatus Parcubacteria bacterium]
MMSGIITSVVLVLGVVGLVWMLASAGGARNDGGGAAAGNVTMENGTQVVRINVRGGYQPALSEVKTGIPTVLRFETQSAYDCSTSIRIPSLGIAKNLPLTGVTDVPVGSLSAGTLHGTCGMGMYRFDIDAK